MPNFQPVTREHHMNKRWQRRTSYAFAAQDAVMPLVAADLPNAMMAMPLGFIQQGEGYVPAAILGSQPGKNLFVAPDGRWVGNYVPAVLRGYPFLLANSQDGQKVLCVDEGSGLLSDGSDGEAFFGDDGQPAQTVSDLLAFLTHIEQSRVVTVAACAVLKKHNLLQPWSTDSGERLFAGLYQVDEAALNAVPDEAFLELRQAGSLPIAYCQLLSMQHLPSLGKLAEAAAQTAANIVDLKEFLNSNDTISFSNF